MRTVITSLGVAVAFALTFTLIPDQAQACGGANTASLTGSPQQQVNKVSASTVAAMLKDAESYGTAIFIYDVNSEKTRQKMGVVPGARLLASSVRYEVSELPEDKSAGLVFYCANTMCGASKEAAKRAIQAGYSNVAVMPEGIKGWRDAGLKTDQANI